MSDLSIYPKTDQFEIIDTIGTPHPFCITTKHVSYASDNHCGMLGEGAIKGLENMTGRPSCGMKGCNLMFDEHEQALLIEVDDDRDLQDIPELHDYLLECKPLCEQEGFAGFA